MGTPDDGWRWQQGLISNPGAWTLTNPDGWWIAHVYECANRTYAGVWDDGETITAGHAKSGGALRAVEDVARPCASGGCPDARVPGTPYCDHHDGGPEGHPR